MSPATVHHTEAVFSIFREVYGREHDDPVDDLDVNMAIWGGEFKICKESSLEQGETVIQWLENWSVVKQNCCKNDWFPRIDVDVDKLLVRSSLSALQRQSLYVFSDSVLCAEKMGDDPIATWKSKI